jgi:hypothetical protein
MFCVFDCCVAFAGALPERSSVAGRVLLFACSVERGMEPMVESSELLMPLMLMKVIDSKVQAC